MGKIRIGPHTIETSNEDKVLFPDEGYTKAELIRYYRRIAETLVPHLKGHPISMHRYPDGIDKQHFYEKRLPSHFPDWIDSVSVPLNEGRSQKQVVVANAATLVYLADQACITPHARLSRADRLDMPDKMIFDLDPTAGDFGRVIDIARMLGDMLTEVGLCPYVQTTGSRGLHVIAPLDRSQTFDTVRDFAHDLADLLSRRHPEDLTIEQRKNKRKGRLFLDYLRNAAGQTAVPPYAVRARPGAPVATPLDWDELSDAKLGPQTYTIKNIFRRLGTKTDPWKDMHRHSRSLNKPRETLNQFLKECAECA